MSASHRTRDRPAPRQPPFLLFAAIVAPFTADAAPSVLSAPALGGSPVPGQTLSASTGTWTENPSSFAFQWWGNGTALEGATDPELTVPFTFAPGSTFQVTVTATSSSGSSTATSGSLVVPAYDADAANWFSRVESGGSSFDLSQSAPDYPAVVSKAIWNELILALKSAGVWGSIGDLSAFCGVRDTTGLKFKIKGTGTNTLYNLPATSYQATGPLAGLKGNGTNGYVDPQRTIASLGITATSGHAFAYLSTDDSSLLGAVISDLPSSGNPRFAMRNGGTAFIHMAGTISKTSPSGKGFVGITLNSTGFQNHAYGTYRCLPTPGVTLTTSNSINFLRTRVSGSYQYANSRLALASLGTALGENACWQFYQAVDRLMTRFGVIPDVPDAVFFGDSGVEGIGSSSAPNRYTRQVAEGLGMNEVNLGISSSRLTKVQSNYIPAGHNRVAEVLKHRPAKVFIPYGPNDANDMLSKGNPTMDAFMTAYGKLVDELVNGGIKPANIMVTGLSWNEIAAGNPSAMEKQVEWNRRLGEIAAAKGTLFVDLLPSSSIGGAAESSDGLHANDTGMARRADTILDAIPPLQLLSAASRKTHGPSGALEIELPVSGTPGIECRTGGANGSHSLVLGFSHPVDDGLVAVLSGTARLAAPPRAAGNTLEIDLIDVADQQSVTLTLENILGAGAAPYSGTFTFRLLLGDANGNGGVSSADTLTVKNSLGELTNADNVRADVNANGNISSADTLVVKDALGNTAPP